MKIGQYPRISHEIGQVGKQFFRHCFFNQAYHCPKLRFAFSAGCSHFVWQVVMFHKSCLKLVLSSRCPGFNLAVGMHIVHHHFQVHIHVFPKFRAVVIHRNVHQATVSQRCVYVGAFFFVLPVFVHINPFAQPFRNPVSVLFIGKSVVEHCQRHANHPPVIGCVNSSGNKCFACFQHKLL